MLHPVAAKLAFSLGKRMGRSNGGHDPSRSVQVGNPMPNVRLNGEFRCPENTGADRQLPRIILGTTKRTRGSGAAQPPARSRL
jgi:hypothetical protein